MAEAVDADIELESTPVRETESDLIAATLAWSARRFGAHAARFVRPTASGGWLVVTWMNDAISVHPADAAEAAMAWMVALGRTHLLVGKPRVASLEDRGLRPIAARNYLGLPVICQDRVLGVIEVAGELRPDVAAAAAAAQDDINRFALRLGYDPSLQPLQALAPESRVVLSSGAWIDPQVTVSADALRFAAALVGDATIEDVAASTGMCLDRCLDIARDLARLGLIDIVG
ncbi:MAG: hypothetical protein DCC58_09325 [Chloroflexi bacterium]|nr:MAG: hypothetical protein DCC58_09325 [Chloroflexota bacterium]